MDVILNTAQIGVQTNTQSTEYEIDNSAGQLFGVLSELYSRPVDSCIREICTNCNDAHIMSKKENKPFIITLPNPDKKIFNLSIRDFGPGLNEVTIDKIFTYGGSSKRDDVEATGCLGLGAKSPYAITDTFYVKSYCDGKLTQYICFKDENNRPNKSKDPIELDTFEENGLEIIIPIWEKHNYVDILKRELKFFKVKPLVYMDNGDGEKTPVKIDWENDHRKEITENIFVNNYAKNITSEFFERSSNYSPIVEQLQIWYPLDKGVILEAIKRYNLKKMYPDGRINEKYQISRNRIKIIDFLLSSDLKIKAKGQVAFSPSRESVKYTERTLEYIITSLNAAARLIEKNIVVKLSSIKSIDDYFEKCVLKKDIFNTIATNFPDLSKTKLDMYKKNLKVTNNLYGILEIKQNQGHTSFNFEESLLKTIYKDGANCVNIGYNHYTASPNIDIIFEWQTQGYQETNFKVIKKLTLDLYRNLVKSKIKNIIESIRVKGLDITCNEYSLNIMDFLRNDVSLLQFLRKTKAMEEYTALKKFFRNGGKSEDIVSIDNSLKKELRDIILKLQHLYVGYINLKNGTPNFEYGTNVVHNYYKFLNKLFPKLNNKGIPKFDILEFYNNLKEPYVFKKGDINQVENLLSTLFKSLKLSFIYNNKNIDLHANSNHVLAYLYGYYTLLYNPYLKEQLTMQQTDLMQYNNMVINQLLLPTKVKNRIDATNYMVKKDENKTKKNISIPTILSPWSLIDVDERKFKRMIKILNAKINYAYNIYEKLYIENLATDFDFDKIAIKQIEKYEIDMEKFPNIFLEDTSEIPEDILIKEYAGYISTLNDYYRALTSVIKKDVGFYEDLYFTGLDSINGVAKISPLKGSKNYYHYSDFISSNQKLYNYIEPETIISDGSEIDVIPVDMDEEIFKDLRFNYINEALSIEFGNVYNKYDSSGRSFNDTFVLFDNEYQFIELKYFTKLNSESVQQSFGKVYIKLPSYYTKDELLENFNYLSKKYKLVAYRTSKSVSTKDRFLTIKEGKDSIFGVFPKNKTMDFSLINGLLENFLNVPFIKKEKYLFLPLGELEYNKCIPKKDVIDKLEVLFKHFEDIYKITRTKKFFYTKLMDNLCSEIFFIKKENSASHNITSKLLLEAFLIKPDNKMVKIEEYNDSVLRGENSETFLGLYNVYKILNSDESEFNFSNILMEHIKENYKYSNSWDFEINEFYPKIKTQTFENLRSQAKVIWETLNNLYPEVLKDFSNHVEKIERIVENENLQDLLNYITNNEYFIKIMYIRNEILDIFYTYSSTSFTNNFSFEQKFKTKNSENLYSDEAHLPQSVKLELSKMVFNDDTSEYAKIKSMEKLICRKDNTDIVDIEIEENSLDIIYSSALMLSYRKSLSDISILPDTGKRNLTSNIKLFLNKSANFEEKINRKMYVKRSKIFDIVPEYFKRKWSYLKLNNFNFKKYVLNQKINKKEGSCKS